LNFFLFQNLILLVDLGILYLIADVKPLGLSSQPSLGSVDLVLLLGSHFIRNRRGSWTNWFVSYSLAVF